MTQQLNKESHMKVLSPKIHTIIGLVVGVALLAAPWLFMFNDVGGAAVTVPLVIGAFIIVNELITTSSASPLKLVPMRIHIMLDVVTGLVLAASPWLFGFADEKINAWLPHLIVGLAVVGYALITNPDGDNRNTVTK